MYHSIYEKNLNPELASPEHLGGKGFGLWWMQQQGINVPPALIFPTTLCADYRVSPKATMKAIRDVMPDVLHYFTTKFGYMPLLSVRSGARASMPGMMDTILNVGINGSNGGEWAERLGADCAENCRHRLKEMYGSTVMGLTRAQIADMTIVPEDAVEQILDCIEAVFKSWDNERAKFYRKMNNIPEDWGTAVTLQAMVFGNMNENSGTGVLFTRNPDSGEDIVVGEFLPNAQGEDVVAGTATPLPLSQMVYWNNAIATELNDVVCKLEQLKGDVQDVEFTIQDGKLYILQTRTAKRSAKAAIKIAMDMVESGMLQPKDAFKRVSRKEYDLAQMAVLDPKFKNEPAYTGIPACGGVVSAVVMKSAEAAINCKEPCILVTQETTPDDIQGMHAAKAVLTMTGGATSHAAVVARSMNKPCIVGLSIDLDHFTEGDVISIDGSTGRVWYGEVPIIDGSDDPALTAFRMMMWQHVSAMPIEAAGNGGSILVQMANHYADPIDSQVKYVCQRVKAAEHVYLDCTPNYDENEEAFFVNFLPSGVDSPEQRLVARLDKFDFKGKLTLITNMETKQQKLPVVAGLKELLFASGDCVLLMEMDKYAKRVLELTGAKLTPIVIGARIQGSKSFITESQLVVDLLK